jgi:hypothetical protein
MEIMADIALKQKAASKPLGPDAAVCGLDFFRPHLGSSGYGSGLRKKAYGFASPVASFSLPQLLCPCQEKNSKQTQEFLDIFAEGVYDKSDIKWGKL